MLNLMVAIRLRPQLRGRALHDLPCVCQKGKQMPSNCCRRPAQRSARAKRGLRGRSARSDMCLRGGSARSTCLRGAIHRETYFAVSTKKSCSYQRLGQLGGRTGRRPVGRVPAVRLRTIGRVWRSEGLRGAARNQNWRVSTRHLKMYEILSHRSEGYPCQT